MRNTANPEPGRMHSASGNSSNYIKDSLTVIKCIEDGRHLAHILCKCPQPDKMTCNPKKFAHHYPDNICPFRNYNTSQLFNGEKVSKIIHNPAQIIDAIGIWNKCMP